MVWQLILMVSIAGKFQIVKSVLASGKMKIPSTSVQIFCLDCGACLPKLKWSSKTSEQRCRVLAPLYIIAENDLNFPKIVTRVAPLSFIW